MHVNANGKRIYSHTSLSLWRLCPRKWYNRYILGLKAPVGIQAAFSVHLVHKPLAAFYGGNTPDWAGLWKAFSEEIGADNADNFHSVGAGQRILEAVRRTPPQLSVEFVESERFDDFGVAGYTSRADLIGKSETGRHYTMDWKYTEAKWKTDKQPWAIRPLLPYDDQLLGQAICAEADGFIRGTIRRNPSTGAILGPIYEESLVDAALRREWLSETLAVIQEIEDKLTAGLASSWPKNTDSCRAFGRDCEYLKLCKGGFQIAERKQQQ